MDPLGAAALVVAAVAGAVAAWNPPWAGRAAGAAVLAWWAAVAVLAHRFLAVDLRLAEVAALTRDEVPAGLRLAGVWAGPAGSLLCWFAVVTTVAWAATRGGSQRLVGVVSALGAPVVLALAGPFERVAEPVLAGLGLNPVLEHPMMLVHPPLLYTAQATVLTTALVGHVRGVEPARRWAAVAAGLLTVSSLLGAWWAHDELGWGGWWAWDPVENTALAPLVALIASLHCRTAMAAQRWRVAAAVAVLAGVALTRSGLPRSVHAFASDRAIGALFALAALAVCLLLVPRAGGPAPPAEAAAADQRRRIRIAARVTGLGAAWILIVVGAAGIAAAILGVQDPPAAVDGGQLGRLIAPVGIAAAVALALLGFRRGASAWSMVAHAGALVFGVGVLGSTLTSSALGTVELGVPARVGDSAVTVTAVRLDEERSDLVRLEVDATVDGRSLTAAILDHPDLARTRARPGRVLDLTGETELVVLTVRGERIRVEVRRHPGLPAVWLGGAACAVGLVGSAGQSRRRRLAASSESSVESDPSLESPV